MQVTAVPLSRTRLLYWNDFLLWQFCHLKPILWHIPFQKTAPSRKIYFLLLWESIFYSLNNFPFSTEVCDSSSNHTNQDYQWFKFLKILSPLPGVCRGGLPSFPSYCLFWRILFWMTHQCFILFSAWYVCVKLDSSSLLPVNRVYLGGLLLP